MVRCVLIGVLLTLCFGCPDNREPPLVISTLRDGGSDSSLSINLTPDADIDSGEADESCYFFDERVDDMCIDGLVEVNLPRGDRCAAPCTHQIECPRGCTCHHSACIPYSDLL